MARQLRRVLPVLRLFDVSFDSPSVKREDTKIIIRPNGPAELHLLLRSSEVFGVWLMRYEIEVPCLRSLLHEHLIESRGVSAEGEEFDLTEKGREWLRKS